MMVDGGKMTEKKHGGSQNSEVYVSPKKTKYQINRPISEEEKRLRASCILNRCGQGRLPLSQGVLYNAMMATDIRPEYLSKQGRRQAVASGDLKIVGVEETLEGPKAGSSSQTVFWGEKRNLSQSGRPSAFSPYQQRSSIFRPLKEPDDLLRCDESLEDEDLNDKDLNNGGFDRRNPKRRKR